MMVVSSPTLGEHKACAWAGKSLARTIYSVLPIESSFMPFRHVVARARLSRRMRKTGKLSGIKDALFVSFVLPCEELAFAVRLSL